MATKLHGYTATISGQVTALTGILGGMVAPFVDNYSTRVDGRWLVFIGVMWLGCITLLCSFNTTDMSAFQIGWPLLLQGIGMSLFFVRKTGLALAAVNEEEMESAAGLMSFCGTMSGAIATSLMTTSWENGRSRYQAELAGLADRSGEAVNGMVQSDMTSEAAHGVLAQAVQAQSVMLSTTHIFAFSAAAFLFAPTAVWFVPKQTRVVDTSTVHRHPARMLAGPGGRARLTWPPTAACC